MEAEIITPVMDSLLGHVEARGEARRSTRIVGI